MVVYLTYVYHVQNVENHMNQASLQKKHFLRKKDPFQYLKKNPLDLILKQLKLSMKKNYDQISKQQIKTNRYYHNINQIIDEKVLRPDFGTIIREARMKKGITQENVSNQISEKITLYKKIETGAIKPNEILSKKLERVLGIQLYENLVENNENEDD